MAAIVLLGACATEEPGTNKYQVPGTDGAAALPDASPDVGIADGAAGATLSLYSVFPTHGPFVGGTVVTLQGGGFTKTCKVQIGGKNIQVGKTKVTSAATLTVVAPAGQPGAADVEVTCGKDKAKLAKAYTYDAVYMDPSSGPTTGGTLVQIYGTGTNFAAGMKLSLGGKAMPGVSVTGATALSAKTPAGAAGQVDLVVVDGKGKSTTVKGAFTYYVSANPKSGGLGGGPLKGTLTVTVLDSMTRAPVDGASVLVHDDTQTHFTGKTDTKGGVVFSKAGFKGPVNVTAGKTKYESTTVVNMDARDLTIFLVQIASPGSGTGPPGPIAGSVSGHLMFGGSTGAGTSAWKIVPEPKTDEVKRAYIHSSLSSLGAKLPDIATIQFVDYDPTVKKTAWAYTMSASPGMKAVYALAGIYNKTSSKFTPHAIGVARGVVVSPGQTTKNVDILIQAPLGRTITLQLKDIPAGSKIHKVRLGIDLGAEGFIVRSDNEISGSTAPPASLSFARLPNFNYQGLTDASWAVDASLDGSGTPTTPGLPYIRGTTRAMKAVNDTLTMGKFVGGPSLDDPVKGQYLTGNTLKWTPSGATADVAVIRVLAAGGLAPTPVWRILARGTATSVKLPDPKTAGLEAYPTGKLLIWAQWMIHLHAGYKFDEFNYSHLYTRYWDRWSQEQSYFQLKTTP